VQGSRSRSAFAAAALAPQQSLGPDSMEGVQTEQRPDFPAQPPRFGFGLGGGG